MYWHVFFSMIFGSVMGLIFALFGRNQLPGFLHYRGCYVKFKERFRPRYLASELQSKELLFIGVMTAGKYVETRAKAVYDTWGRQVPGRLEIFIAGENKMRESELPIRTLPGVHDNEYPPQKKVMNMLRYMYDHYIDKYEWFMRADDDVYVRTEKLESLLRTLDSSNDTVVGQGGVGKSDEVNKLGLVPGECYCIGGPGVIMSRNVLSKIGPNIDRCLNDTASTHEDVELGRCIRKFAGVSCLWSEEAKVLFQQVYKDQTKAYHGTLDVARIRKAVTLHPVKDPAYMFRLHFHFLSMKLRKRQHDIYKNTAIIERTKQVLMVKSKSENMTFRSRNVDFYRQCNTSSKLQWEFVTTKRVFDLDSQHFRWLSSLMMTGLNRALGKAMKDLDNHYTRILGQKKRSPIQLTDVDYGYLRVNPKHGVQFSFAFYTKTQKDRLRLPWSPTKPEYHRKYVQHAFSKIQAIVKKNSPNSIQTVHFIVPLKGKLDEFKRFLESLRDAFLIPGEKVEVLVVYFPENSFPEEHIKSFNKLKSDYPSAKFRWENIDGEFNRAKALQKGAEYFGDNSLLFFSDVDLVFKRDLAYRCRDNTIQGKQVYFPVMFGQYNREVAYFGEKKPKTNFIYTSTAGLWRKYSFGPVCIYASDVKNVGGLDTTIKGWGKEDVDFVGKVLKSGLEVFRVPDPSIVHVFHVHAPCDASRTQEQREMCQRSTLSTYAPKPGLVSYLMAKKYIE